MGTFSENLHLIHIGQTMETLSEFNKQNRRLNKIHIIGVLIAVILISAGIFYLLQTPPQEVQKAMILEGSLREGDPKFQEITKDIIISTDPDTVQSPNAFGKISMFIKGNIKNYSKNMINGLEVKVVVVDRFNQPIKEKRVLVVPTQQATLGPNESIPITLSVDGFTPEDDRANITWRVTAIRVAE